MAIKSLDELVTDFVDEVQSQDPTLTDDNDGSIIDILAGAFSAGIVESQATNADSFKKTFLDTAHGPDVTGGPDDLQTLAVDHWGDDFIRPPAVKATGTVQFTRPTAGAGNILIPEGTIVKTPADATGASQRFETIEDVTIVATSIEVAVRALVAGVAGNVDDDEVTEIESTLNDPTIVVNNADAFGGGSAVASDAEYREIIRQKITAVRGASIIAVEAAALAVPGVETAKAVELERAVIEYDIATDDIKVGAEFFRIPYVYLYIADETGTASDALIDDVWEALEGVRALGVRINIYAAVALDFDWTAAITLDAGGPNYATFSSDPQLIIDAMRAYVAAIPVGTGFDVSDANAAMLAMWGPSGTGDITAFSTSVPVGDVAVDANEKLVPDDVEIG